MGTSGGVLGSTTSIQVGLEVLEKVLIETHVLGLGEDGVVGLQSVLLKKSSISVYVVSGAAGLESFTADAYPTAWMSRRGFSRHKSSYLPILNCDFGLL